MTFRTGNNIHPTSYQFPQPNGMIYREQADLLPPNRVNLQGHIYFRQAEQNAVVAKIRFQNTPSPPSLQNRTIREQIYDAIKAPRNFLEEMQKIPIDFENLRRNSKYKASFCASALDGTTDCRYKERCQFAHSLSEKYRYNIHCNPRYKSEACSSTWEHRCTYGEKCKWGHEGDLMRRMEQAAERLYIRTLWFTSTATPIYDGYSWTISHGESEDLDPLSTVATVFHHLEL